VCRKGKMVNTFGGERDMWSSKFLKVFRSKKWEMWLLIYPPVVWSILFYFKLFFECIIT
jgi:hypothetical protein